MDDNHKQRLVNNLISVLQSIYPEIRKRAVAEFTKIDSQLGKMLQHGLSKTEASHL